jgi:hypothetical protein
MVRTADLVEYSPAATFAVDGGNGLGIDQWKRRRAAAISKGLVTYLGRTVSCRVLDGRPRDRG